MKEDRMKPNFLRQHFCVIVLPLFLLSPVLAVEGYEWSFYADTNGWLAQGVTGVPLDTTTWDSRITANFPSGVFDLTWRQFCGGIDYPLGDVEGVGYFVYYSKIGPDTYKFDWMHSIAPYHFPGPAGETLAGFYAYVDRTCSQFLLAYIDNAQDGTLGNGPPEVPEPTTMCLFGLGGLALLKKKR
jgi:hypothetical protein